MFCRLEFVPTWSIFHDILTLDGKCWRPRHTVFLTMINFYWTIHTHKSSQWGRTRGGSMLLKNLNEWLTFMASLRCLKWWMSPYLTWGRCLWLRRFFLMRTGPVRKRCLFSALLFWLLMSRVVCWSDVTWIVPFMLLMSISSSNFCLHSTSSHVSLMVSSWIVQVRSLLLRSNSPLFHFGEV